MPKKILGSGSFTIDDVLLRGVVSSENASDDLSVTRDVRVDGLDQLAGPGYCKNVQPYPEAIAGAAGFALHGFGYVGGGNSLSSSFRQYNDISNVWTSVPGVTLSPRNVLGVFVLNDLAYFCGGATALATGTATSSVQCFNDAVGFMSVRVGVPRISIWPSTWAGGGFGFVGGGDDYADVTFTMVTEIDQYNDAVNNWSVCSGSLPQARGNMGAFALDSYTYLAGGYSNTTYFSSVVRFDDSVMTCLTMNSVLPVSRRISGSDDGVGGGFVLGGYDSSSARSEVYQFNAATVSFQQRDHLTLAALAYNSTFGLNGCAYVGPNEVTGGGGVSTVCQYRSATLFDVPGSFKRSTLMPSHVFVGTSLDGVSKSLPVQVSSNGGSTWVSLSSNKVNSGLNTVASSWVSDIDSTGFTFNEWYGLSYSSWETPRVSDVFLPNANSVYDYRVRVGLPRMSSGGAYIASKPTPGGFSDAALSQGLSQNGFGYVDTGGGSLRKYDDAADYFTTVSPSGFATGSYKATFSMWGYGYWVCGGVWGSSWLGTVQRYDDALGTMSAMTSDMLRYGSRGMTGAGGIGWNVCGNANGGAYTSSVTAYNPSINTWSGAAGWANNLIFGAGACAGGMMTQFGGCQHMITAYSYIAVYNEYSTTWTSMGSLPGVRSGHAGFDLNGLGYVGYGWSNAGWTTAYNDVVRWTWEGAYCTTTAVGGTARGHLSGFSLNDKGYFVGGYFGGAGVGEYGVMSFPENYARLGVTLRVDEVQSPKVNVRQSVLGAGALSVNEFPSLAASSKNPGSTNSNVMTRVASIATNSTGGNYWVTLGNMVRAQYSGVGFDLNGFGYTMNWYDSVSRSEVARFNDTLLLFETRGNSLDPARTNTVGFALNGFGYSVLGQQGVTGYNFADRYSDVIDSWVRMSNAPSSGNSRNGFALNGFGYAVGSTSGDGNTVYSTVSQFSDAMNVWSTRTGMGVTSVSSCSFALNGFGYVAGGWYGTGNVSTLNVFNDAGNVWVSRPGSYSFTARRNNKGGVLPSGGWSTNGYTTVVISECLIYSDDKWYWQVQSPNSVAKDYANAFTLNGSGYSCGGVTTIAVNGVQQFRQADYLLSGSFGHSRLAPKRVSVGTSIDGRFTDSSVRVNASGMGQASTGVNVTSALSVGSNSYQERVGTDLRASFSSVGTGFWKAVGDLPSALRWRAGFSVAGFGYSVGGTADGSVNTSELDQYNDAVNTWSYKMNFGATGNAYSTGNFVLSRAHVCQGNLMKRYDHNLNVWVGETAPVFRVSGFALNGYGYVVGGFDGSVVVYSYLSRYSEAAGTWLSRASLIGSQPTRMMTAAAGTVGYGYATSGSYNNSNACVSDHAQYNDTLNAWTLRLPYPRANGFYGNAFYSLSGMPACQGGGNTTDGWSTDNYAYNETVNIWPSRTALPVVRGDGIAGFALNNLGYVCGGYSGANLSSVLQYQDGVRDYRVRVALPKFGLMGQGTFTQARGNFPVVVYRSVGFNLNGFGYISNGAISDAVWYSSLYRYTEPLDTWVARKSSLLSAGRAHSAGFALNSLGYVSGGYSAGVVSSVESYNDSVDSWSAVQPMTLVRYYAAGFTLNGYSYAALGRTDPVSLANTRSSVERYNDSLNTWGFVVNFATVRTTASFVLNGFSYILGGYNGAGFVSTTSEFNDSGNYEKIIASVPIAADGQAVFALKGWGYVYGGNSGSTVSSIFRYNPSANIWRDAGNIGAVSNQPGCFGTHDGGYVVGGYNGSVVISSVTAFCHQDEYTRVAATLKLEEEERIVLPSYGFPTYVNVMPSIASWTAGTGSVTGYTANGFTSENVRYLALDPWGNTTMIWEGIPTGDSGSGGDGGWGGANFAIDRTKLYRFAVWVNRTVLGNGSFYLGMFSNSSDSGVLNRTDGANNTNPYFMATSWGGYPINTWILVIGHVWPAGSIGTTPHPNSGYYTINNGKLANVSDFVWKSDATAASHRTYLYYSTDASTRQRWCYPRVDCVDGTEPSIGELLSNGYGVNR